MSVLIADIRQEGVLVPIATAVDSGKLADARQHLDQVASGLVPAGTKPEETLNALKSEKAAKEQSPARLGTFRCAGNQLADNNRGSHPVPGPRATARRHSAASARGSRDDGTGCRS